jgi:hypothetical protein
MRVFANVVRGLCMALSVVSLGVSMVAAFSQDQHAPVVAVAAAVAGVGWAVLAVASVYGFTGERAAVTYSQPAPPYQAYPPQPAATPGQPYRPQP